MSVLSGVLDEVASSLASDLTVSDFRVSRKDKAVVLVRAGSGELIVRVALSAAALASDEINARMLALLRGLYGLERFVPNSVLRGHVGGHAYFVETRVPGTPLRRLLGRVGFAAMAEQVQAFMDALNPRLDAAAQEPMADARYEREVSLPIGALGPLLADSRAISTLQEYFERKLYGLRLPFGITHGDFSVSNVFVDGQDRLAAVIDWEGAAENSLPILDAIHYVESHHRALTGDRVGRAIPRLARWDFADEAHRAFLLASYARMGISPANHEALVHLKWVRHIAYLANFWLAYDARGIREFVTPVVSSILESPSPSV